MLGVRLGRDDGADPPSASGFAVPNGVVAFVGQSSPGRDVRPEVEQEWKNWAVAGFAARQMEGEWKAVEVRLEVDFGREAAARAAKGLAGLPPFAPAAET